MPLLIKIKFSSKVVDGRENFSYSSSSFKDDISYTADFLLHKKKEKKKKYSYQNLLCNCS